VDLFFVEGTPSPEHARVDVTAESGLRKGTPNGDAAR
jgi:hypothetical protein